MASPISDASAKPNTVEYWRAQITAAEEKRDPLVTEWRNNVQRYLAKTLPIQPKAHTVVVPLDYANTEQKKAQLFFRVPELHLKATRPEYEGAVPVFQAVVNHYLGRHGVDAKTMMDEVLFDALCPSGLAVTKIGYEPTIHGMRTVPDPQTGLPMPDPNDPTQPATVPNVIHEAYYWNRISPEKALIPADFHGSQYDRSPWLGFKFELDADVGIRRFRLPKDFQGGRDHAITGLNEAEAPKQDAPRKKIRGWEIWYKLSLVDPTEPPESAGGVSSRTGQRSLWSWFAALLLE